MIKKPYLNKSPPKIKHKEKVIRNISEVEEVDNYKSLRLKQKYHKAIEERPNNKEVKKERLQRVKLTDPLPVDQSIAIYEATEKNSDITCRARLKDKCSTKEALEREEQFHLNIFEADKDKSYYDSTQQRWHLKVNYNFAIKAYSRPAADIKMDNPDNLRTPKVKI